MKDTNAIAREQQRRNAELAAEMREALRPMPPMTRTDGWTGYTWADLTAYAAQCVRDERDRHADALRCALEALDYCIEDSAELLNERTVQWGEYRKDRQAAMAATLERHRAEDGALLTLAATAAGLDVLSWLQDGYPFVEDRNGKRYGWNPLVFDSDAFRLTVQLGLALVPYPADIAALHNASGRSWAEMRGADTYAAARRAIVRAAAALGAEKTPNARAEPDPTAPPN